MTFANCNLIDAQQVQIFQPGAQITSGEVGSLHLFDRIPAESQVVSDFLNSHMPRQFHNVSFEDLGIGAPGIDEIDPGLADNATNSTGYSRQLRFDINLFAADRQGMESSRQSSLTGDLNTSAVKTSQGKGIPSMLKTSAPC